MQFKCLILAEDNTGHICMKLLALLITMINDFATAIICDGKVPTDWEQSFIVCLNMDKCDALTEATIKVSS